jgi:hypothetical protein
MQVDDEETDAHLDLGIETSKAERYPLSPQTTARMVESAIREGVQ